MHGRGLRLGRGAVGTGRGGDSLSLDIHAREAGVCLGVMRTLDWQGSDMARAECMKGLVGVMEKVGWRKGGEAEAQRKMMGTRPGATEAELEKKWQTQESCTNQQHEGTPCM